MVIGRAEIGGALAVGDRSGEVAVQQRHAGAVHGDLRGESSELGVMVDDQLVLRAIRFEPRFDVVEELLDPCGVAEDHPGADAGEVEHRSVGEHLLGEGVEPLLLGGVLPCLTEVGDAELDQLGGFGTVACCQGMAKSLGSVTVGLEPVSCAVVQVGDAAGVLVGEAGPEDIAEQVVVPVPAATVIERDQEQVRPFKGVENHLRVASPGHRSTQVRREPAQDRGLQQEDSDVVGLTIEDLIREVVDDESVVTGEARDER